MQTKKPTLAGQKHKRRSLSTDCLTMHDEQAVELERELQKVVTIGPDTVNEYEQHLQSAEMKENVKRGL